MYVKRDGVSVIAVPSCYRVFDYSNDDVDIRSTLMFRIERRISFPSIFINVLSPLVTDVVEAMTCRSASTLRQFDSEILMT